MEIQLGNVKIESHTAEQQRLSALIWGPAGCGKTTLAATAPGKKLWINFDPDGMSSLSGLPNADEFLKLDLSKEKDTIVDKFKDDDPFGLSKVLGDESLGIDTVVVDSITSYAQMALNKVIPTVKGATVERPSPGAYQGRNALTLRLVTSLLRLTAKYNKHIIFIAHEAAPTTDDDGNVLFITIMLGGQLPDQTALQISEVWWMNDTGKERRIAVRPVRTRKPMKTRLFMVNPNIVPEFVWKYDAFNPNPEYELRTWYKRWIDGGGKKLSIPA